jgi:hypothetical protein
LFDWLSADGKTASPVYGFLMPELLNGRFGVYSADGEYYGMLKTVYRAGVRHCVWLSSDLQTSFEDTQFADANLKAFAKFLLDDSGTAFAELMALLAEHLDVAELPLIWGRPLALAKCALILENKGGYPYSQALKDFGKRVTLGAENVEFPAMLGDMKRANSGLIGYFDGVDFSKIYPAFNSAPQTPGYVRYGETLTLSLARGVRELTLLTEIGGDVLIQTGILPLTTARLAAEFVEAAATLNSRSRQPRYWERCQMPNFRCLSRWLAKCGNDIISRTERYIHRTLLRLLTTLQIVKALLRTATSQ